MRSLGGNTVLLFYREYEADLFLPGDKYLKRLLRPIYNKLHHRQKVSGFLMWYQLLVNALERLGLDVRTNDYRTARRHPNHPVGLVGYPQVLDGWDLPNPALLGPGLHDHPALAPDLMDDPRFQLYIVTCEWMRRVFQRYYEDVCVPWFAGIDLTEWPDTSNEPKDVDVLVYDKVRWNREERERDFIAPIMAQLGERGLRVATVRYKLYDHEVYRQLLSRSRSMLFLCEHETQGMAYQEALASNLPIMAWDQGLWLDPQRFRYGEDVVEATSVPYFSEECGERFTGLGDFSETFDLFWSRLPRYRPREYVDRELSPERSGELYMQYYRQVGERAWSG